MASATSYRAAGLLAVSMLLWAAGAMAVEVVRLGGLGIDFEQARALSASTGAGSGPSVIPAHGEGWWQIIARRDWSGADSPVLVLETPWDSSFEVWTPGAATAQIREKHGQHADPSYPPRYAVVALDNGIAAGQSILVRVERAGPTRIGVRLMSAAELRAEALDRTRFESLTQGTLLALILAGIGLALSVRERSYLLLALGLAGALLYQAASTGAVFNVPGLSAAAMVLPLQRIGGLTGSLFLCAFLCRYLDARQLTPRLARMVKAALWGIAGLLVLSFIPTFGMAGIWSTLGNLLLLVALSALLATGIVGARRGDRPSRMFLWSWTPLLLLIVWRTIEVEAGLAASRVLELAFPLGMIFAGVLLILGLAERAQRYRIERDEADRRARIDPLTGIANREALDDDLRQAVERARREHAPLAILFADIDHFKLVNDRFGHEVGDRCLCEVVERIRLCLRGEDLFGRIGGEEFLIGLPGLDGEQAVTVAERIRAAVAADRRQTEPADPRVTITLGVAELAPDGDLDLVIRRADAALRAGKRAGRDRVRLWTAADGEGGP